MAKITYVKISSLGKVGSKLQNFARKHELEAEGKICPKCGFTNYKLCVNLVLRGFAPNKKEKRIEKMKKVMGFEINVNHEGKTVSVTALAPYSYEELSVLFCCLGEVLDAIEKNMKKGENE